MTETDDAPERLPNRIDKNSTRSLDFVLTQEDIYTSKLTMTIAL